MTVSSWDETLSIYFPSSNFIFEFEPILIVYFLHLLLAVIFLSLFKVCFFKIKCYANFHVLFWVHFDLSVSVFRELKASFHIIELFF